MVGQDWNDPGNAEFDHVELLCSLAYIVQDLSNGAIHLILEQRTKADVLVPYGDEVAEDKVQETINAERDVCRGLRRGRPWCSAG